MNFKNIKRKYLELNSKLSKYVFTLCWGGVCDLNDTDSFGTVDGIVTKIHEVIDVAVYGSALIAVIILVYGGYTYILAGGDDQKIEQGSSIITSGVIGLIIIFAANIILRFVIDKVIGVS